METLHSFMVHSSVALTRSWVIGARSCLRSRTRLLVFNEQRALQDDVKLLHRPAQIFEADVVVPNEAHILASLVLSLLRTDHFEFAHYLEHLILQHHARHLEDSLVTRLQSDRFPDVPDQLEVYFGYVLV